MHHDAREREREGEGGREGEREMTLTLISLNPGAKISLRVILSGCF